jgi:putative pyruvate formate lyase activating enzyme
MALSKLELVRKANKSLEGSLSACAICPRKCGADRAAGRSGYCRAGYDPVVYSYAPHHGEEPPVSGNRGSGTIFFSHCNMKCAYCQNYQFSQLDRGRQTTSEKLAEMMIHLQDTGCHNINLVNPTHYVVQILKALELALEKGLDIPIVYNTSGYELADTVSKLYGIVDIYLPDMRYSDNEAAKRYSDAPDYVDRNRAAVKEMQAQVGTLELDASGIAVRGLIIRLLVLPENISGTEITLKFISDNICKDTYLSIMSQYHPTFKAGAFSEISRTITPLEYSNVVDEAHLLGLNNGWVQDAPEELDPRFLGTNIPPKQ